MPQPTAAAYSPGMPDGVGLRKPQTVAWDARTMSTATPITYRVETYNVSHASENKIHDDAVARQLGFASGLVPGVEVYAYACHPIAQRWGRAWLERGGIE